MTLKNVAAASLALCAAMPVAAQTLEDFPSPEIKFCYEAIIAGNVFSDLRFMPEEVGNGFTYVYPGTDVKFGLLSCFSSILVLNSNPYLKKYL